MVAGIVSVVGYCPGLDLTLVDAQGRPIEGAYVVYRFKGYRFNLVDSITYRRPGGVAKSDGRGHVDIPGFPHTRPFLSTSLRPWIELVYAPNLHNAHRVQPGRSPHSTAMGTVEVTLNPPGYRMRDLSAAPQAWQQSIQTLYSVVRFDLIPCLREQRCRVTESPAPARELGQRVFDEHPQFLRRHGDSARGMPVEDSYFLSRPLEEQRVIRARWREDLSAFPTWGTWTTNHWQKNLEELRGQLD